MKKKKKKTVLENAGEIFANVNPIETSDPKLIFAKNAEDCYGKMQTIFWVKFWVVTMVNMLALAITETPAVVIVTLPLAAVLVSFIENKKPNDAKMAEAWQPHRKTLLREMRWGHGVRIRQTEEGHDHDFVINFENWLEDNRMYDCAACIVGLQKDGVEHEQKIQDRKQKLTNLWMKMFSRPKCGDQPPWTTVFDQAIADITDAKQK